MARLNTRPSNSTVTSSAFASVTPTPAPGESSDQENRDPEAVPHETGKSRAMPPPVPRVRSSLPTPTSDHSSDTAAHSRKRKRGDALPTNSQYEDPEEERFNRWFDPNQDADVRREVKRKGRMLERRFNESRDELLRNNDNGLTDAVVAANSIFRHVKQTDAATLDSRLLVNVSDVASKKTANLVLGDTRTGVDVDEFLSKCIRYMRHGGARSDADDVRRRSMVRRRQTRNDSDDEDAYENSQSSSLDWERLGREVCFAHNLRPAVPSFLLGPLSVEKKQRTQTQRRARNAGESNARETRPENLTKADLQQSDENGLTAICTRIRNLLVRHIRKAEETLRRAGFESEEDLHSERGQQLLRKCRMTTAGGPSLFDFIVNPHSFGQTVENLFYVSFLIKEGSIGVASDDDELPVLMIPEDRVPLEEKRKHPERHQKHLGVFAIDHATWRDLVCAFDIRQCMIPHREEPEHRTQIDARGWYA